MELLRLWLIQAAITWPLLAVGIVWFARASKQYQAAKIADLRSQGLWGAPADHTPHIVHVAVLKPVTGPVLTGSTEPAPLAVRVPDRVSVEPVPIHPAITAG